MDPFPTELWTEIFQNLRKCDRLSVSRTCRALCKIALPELYRDIYLLDEVTVTLFAQSLDDSPSLAEFVHTLRLGSWFPKSNTFVSSRVLRRISSFSNLCALELVRLRVDSDLCAALDLLPRLRVVIYTRCEIVDPIMDLPVSHGGRLYSVSLKHPLGDDWSSLIPPALQSLKLEQQPLLRKSTALMRKTLSQLIWRPLSQQLIELNFTGGVPQIIIEFLLACPQLRKLSLPGEFPKVETPIIHTLPPHALPFLEEFSGYCDFVETFVVGRCIHTCHIQCTFLGDEPANALRSLHRSLVPVTKLTICHSLTPDTLQDAPVTLRELDVVHRITISQSLWLSPLSMMHELYVLRVYGARVAPANQSELVHTASVTCPSLREFVFDVVDLNEIHTWDTWRWRKEGTWERYPHVSEVQPAYHDSD